MCVNNILLWKEFLRSVSLCALLQNLTIVLLTGNDSKRTVLMIKREIGKIHITIDCHPQPVYDKWYDKRLLFKYSQISVKCSYFFPFSNSKGEYRSVAIIHEKDRFQKTYNNRAHTTGIAAGAIVDMLN